MKAKKLLALLLTAAMCLTLLAGCSSNGPKEPNAPADNKGGKTVIKMTKWGEPESEGEVVKAFNETHDDIELVLDAVPGDGYGDRLTTSFSSGEGYDIFLSGEGDMYKWVSMGMVESLDPFIQADTEWKNDMTQTSTDMGKIEGTQYYFMKDYGPLCLWYNRDMFDAAGVAYPTDDWTWDDLYAAAQKLTTKNDKGEPETFGFQAQSWGYAVASYLESLDLPYVSEDFSTADGYLNNPKLTEALDTYFSWAEGEDRISPNTADTDTYGNGTSMMINGKLAMFISGMWARTGLDEAEVNYGTALVPGNHKNYFCAAGYAMSTNCKNKEAAWEVMKFLASQQASEFRVTNTRTSVLPTSQVVMDKLVAEFPEHLLPILKSVDYSVAPVGMRGKVGAAVNVALNDVLEKIAYKEAPTQEILDDAVKNLEVK